MDFGNSLWGKVKKLERYIFGGGNTVGEEVWGDYLANAIDTALNNAASGEGHAVVEAPYHESLGTDINEIRANFGKADKMRFRMGQVSCECAINKVMAGEYAMQISGSSVVSTSGVYAHCAFNADFSSNTEMKVYVLATLHRV